jgi:hypothetical protein
MKGVDAVFGLKTDRNDSTATLTDCDEAGDNDSEITTAGVDDKRTAGTVPDV